MFSKPHCPVIAIEEHYWDEELEKTYVGGESGRPGEQSKRLHDFTGIRIKEMDDVGIDVQVLSHGAPSTQKLPADAAAALTQRVNDRLHAAVKANPTALRRVRGAADRDAGSRRRRARTHRAKLGFKGAMMHGLANGMFLDDKKFWPIYARAEKLDVPIYLHPSLPNADVMRIYYQDYVKDFPMVARPAWGYTVETATTAIRLVLSGVFEKHPKLKIILGHLGETLPFLVWRIDQALSRPGNKSMSFRDIFCNNFYITTSGNFSNPALLCCVMEMGVDHILFAVDWPFVDDNPPATEWMAGIPLSDDDKAKILSGNAKRLLRM